MARRTAAALIALVALSGCGGGEAPARPPLLVIGVDGFDRKPIEALWARGEMPQLRRLAEAGTFLPLRTAYAKSPVIWTTIATGVTPEEHGVLDFVVATPKGDLPITSATRRRPALWDHLERTGRRSAVLGWWATWPAEQVERSIVLSDRAGLGLEHEISPPERAGDLARWLTEARAGGPDFGDTGGAGIRDRVVTLAAEELVREPFDLVLAYYRSVDIVSHWQWHTFEPGKFPDGPPPGVQAAGSAEPVLDAYRAIDVALGRIVAASPAGTSFLVLSDHGFHAERKTEVALHLDFDRVLEALGFLARGADGAVDARRSRARSHLSPPFRQVKLVRLRDDLPAAERAAVLAALRADLGRVRFPDGSAVFAPRDPDAGEAALGAELAVPIVARAFWDRVELDGRPVEGAVLPLARLTGTHDLRTAGVLVASGPLFARDAAVARIRIHDVAPTVLFALGLPIADDFAGELHPALFAPGFVASHPVRRIASWGTREAGEAPESAQDARLLDELAALGYLR